MALKAVLQTLDGVPEALRTEYKERDGKFYLDIDGIDDHDGVGALRRAKDYEKDEARKAKERARDLLAELTALRTRVVQLEAELASARSEIASLKKNSRNSSRNARSASLSASFMTERYRNPTNRWGADFSGRQDPAKPGPRRRR